MSSSDESVHTDYSEQGYTASVRELPATFDEQLRSSVRLINTYVGACLAVLILVSFSVSIFGTDAWSDQYPLRIPNGTWRLVALFGLQLLSYLLSNHYTYKVTATITFISFLLCIIVYPLLPILTYAPEDLLILLITTIPMSLAPYMIFNIEKDHGYIIFWQLCSLLLYLFAMGETLLQLELEYPSHFLVDVFKRDPIILMGHLGVLIFLNLIFYTYRKSYYRQHQQLRELNERQEARMNQLAEQRYLLQRYRNELVNLQDLLRKQNEGLEEEVALRTRKLEAQNKTLMQYGFLNSRLVRTPILKLRKIMRQLEGTNFRELMERSAEIEDIVSDLDEITLTIGQVLSDMHLETVDLLRERIETKYTLS